MNSFSSPCASCLLKKRTLWFLERALSFPQLPPQLQAPEPQRSTLRLWSTAPKTLAPLTLKVPSAASVCPPLLAFSQKCRLSVVCFMMRADVFMSRWSVCMRAPACVWRRKIMFVSEGFHFQEDIFTVQLSFFFLNFLKVAGKYKERPPEVPGNVLKLSLWSEGQFTVGSCQSFDPRQQLWRQKREVTLKSPTEDVLSASAFRKDARIIHHVLNVSAATDNVKTISLLYEMKPCFLTFSMETTVICHAANTNVR